jgi:2-polyprenyl-3-methyl-5-hydroxy-6-metoxy-1,4-benzoquinol methylase
MKITQNNIERKTRACSFSKPSYKLWNMTSSQGLMFFRSILECSGIDDTDHLLKIAKQTIDHLKNPKDKRNKSKELELLMLDWYDRLSSGSPAYEIYSKKEYLSEVWACWLVYSRKYIKEIAIPTVCIPRGIFGEIKKGSIIADLGNGIGITSAAFKQAFPDASVIGTNIIASDQWRVASFLSNEYDFGLVESAADIATNVDVAFASEYFEHFEDPIDHLNEIFKAIKPKRMIIANAFTAKAIGHFDVYKRNNVKIKSTSMGSFFSRAMKDLGYSQLNTGLWNNRPQTWILN